MSATRKNFQWFEPKEFFRPRLKAEFASVWPQYRPALLIPISLFLACLSIVLMKKLGETIDLLLCLKMSFVLIFTLGIPWIGYTAYWLIPPSISLSAKGLCIQHGNGTCWLIKDKITSVKIDLTQSATPLLTVHTYQQKQTVGLGSKINPQELHLAIREWFPDIPVHCLTPVLPA